MKLKALLALTVASFGVAAEAKIITGTSNGMTFSAQSHIVGTTSTGTAAANGNPIYNATAAQYRGTVALIMDYGPDVDGNPQRFICSGSLMADRRSILTAGHCVSSGANTANPLSTTAYFYNGNDPDAILTTVGTAVAVSDYFVNSGYTGEVIDQNDIAVLRLADFAPAFANAYDLYTGELTGVGYNIAGVGGRSTIGGAAGVNAGTGRLRQGDNRYDFRLGDSDFNGFWTTEDSDGNNFFGSADIEFSYLSDFDNGRTANDASCKLAAATTVVGGGTAKYCNLGVGAKEASSAGGDSGGPQFVNGQVASVTSYGITFGPDFGDVDYIDVNGNGIFDDDDDARLNSSFGEFNGFVPVSIHQNFIRSSLFSAAVPEPATWAMMIAGFGLVGGSMRASRRRETLVAA